MSQLPNYWFVGAPLFTLWELIYTWSNHPINQKQKHSVDAPINWLEDSNRDGKISQDEMAMALKALNPKISTETWHNLTWNLFGGLVLVGLRYKA